MAVESRLTLSPLSRPISARAAALFSPQRQSPHLLPFPKLDDMRPDAVSGSGSERRGRSALLTVGSTSFPDLIAAALARPALDALVAAGFDELLLQYGESTLPLVWTAAGSTPEGLTVTSFAFRDGIEELYPGVDLVISHAGASDFAARPVVLRGLTRRPTHPTAAPLTGAGSILTSLRAGKTLITIVNGSFADNHQSELADALGGQGHLLVATPACAPPPAYLATFRSYTV